MIGTQANIERIVVVVPAHDEQELLRDCLDALETAVAQSPVETEVIVVLDSCTDSSAHIADEWAHRTGAMVVTADGRNVGAARAAGFAAAVRSPNTWFATTDADSVVREDWLTSQLAHARGGARVVAGTVAADFGHSRRLQLAYDAEYRGVLEHVHGANLGMHADDYWQVGGFASVETDEDVDLIRRFGDAGIRVHYVDDSPVGTSTRRVGRAPDGFSGHLRALDLATAL